MLKREEVMVNLDLPWPTICRLACRAFLDGVTLEEAIERTIKSGLEK